MDKVYLILDDFVVDELLLAPKRQVADGDGQGLSRDPWLKTSNQSVSGHNTHCLGKYPAHWETEHIGFQDATQTPSTYERDLGCLCVGKVTVVSEDKERSAHVSD